MIGKTLTEENLMNIKEAMDKISLIDQSECFKDFYKEIEERLRVKESHKRILHRTND